MIKMNLTLRKKVTFVTAVLSALFSTTTQAAIETYKADPAHSSVNFKIRHFFSTVPGAFQDFEATIVLDTENPANNSVEAVIPVGAVNTNNVKRDKHLRSDDFFNEPVHPQMKFKSTCWVVTGKNTFKVTGNLTILSTTKVIVLDVKLTGSGPNRRGIYLTGWEVKATLDRRDYGITYGQGIVGNEVTVEIFLEAQRQ